MLPYSLQKREKIATTLANHRNSNMSSKSQQKGFEPEYVSKLGLHSKEIKAEITSAGGHARKRTSSGMILYDSTSEQQYVRLGHLG